VGTERSYLKKDATPRLQAASWVQLDVAKKICGMAGLDLDKMFQRAQMKDFKPLQLPIRLKAHVLSQLKTIRLQKCFGDMQGTDPVLGKEAVMYTAHYDHLGIDPSLPATRSTTGRMIMRRVGGILLELARVWAAVPDAAPRSILFAR